MMNTTKITIEVIIAADINKVWDFYTKPEHILKWNFASDDWHCPKVENDLKIGGKLNSRMEAKDGSIGFDFEAVYDEVIKHKKIIYTMIDGRQVTIDFKTLNNKTKIMITFDAETKNPIDMQRDGWQAILDNFKNYVETNN